MVTVQTPTPAAVTAALEKKKKSFQVSHVGGGASDFTHFLNRLSVSRRRNEDAA